MADALEHLLAGVLAAGVLQAVGDDHEDHLAGALGSRHRGQARAELVDRATDRIEQRRGAARDVGVGGEPGRLPDRLAQVDHVVFVVELGERDVHVAGIVDLLGEEGVEAADGVGACGLHRAGDL